jgi:hypothetical protein
MWSMKCWKLLWQMVKMTGSCKDLQPLTSADLEQAKSKMLLLLCKPRDLSIGESIHLARIGGTDSWVMHSDTITYLLKKKGGV